MSHFITSNAVALVALLGVLLVACAFLLFVSMTRRARQRSAVRSLLDLADVESRAACDAATSRFVHDLNNLILVLSMESERLEVAAADSPEASRHIDTLEQVVAEGRELVDHCRAQMVPVEVASSNLCNELMDAARLLTDAGLRDVDVAFAKAVPTTATVSRPATDVHLLVLVMVRAAGVKSGEDRLSLMVSTGRDAALPEDADDQNWVSLSIADCASLPEDDARIDGLSRAARRLSGELVLPEQGGNRRRLAVSLPVVRGGGPA